MLFPTNIREKHCWKTAWGMLIIIYQLSKCLKNKDEAVKTN